MNSRCRKAILAWALATTAVGLAGPAHAQFAQEDRPAKTELTARAGVGGWRSAAPHLMFAMTSGPVRVDFDYGAAPMNVMTSEVKTVEELCQPPQCTSYRWLSKQQQINTTSVDPGRMLRFGIGFLPNDLLALGLRVMAANPGAGAAAWLEAGPPLLRLYAGVNDGGLAALPLQGPRMGIHSSFDLGRLLVRAELAAGWGLRQSPSEWLAQGAVIIGQRPTASGFSGEVMLGGASSGADPYLQAAVGLRWVGTWAPDAPYVQPRRAKVAPYKEVLADVDAAHWLGRETTWLHRPSGLAQTCTVTEAVAMGDIAWLYQTCTPGPADALVPWATGCYVVDRDGLWRLPVCPGEAPGKLTRPQLLVPRWGNADPRFADLHDATWQQRTLKLAGRKVEVDCQRVPGRQTYEACSSQAEGLLFASVRAGLAADRKRWPARSTELVSLRKVDVPAGGRHFGPEVSQCHWSSACRVLGECSSKGDGCVALRDEDCAASAVCAVRGACGAAAGRCAPATAAMCESSENCRRLGQCKVGKVVGAPACVAAVDGDCAAAEVCAVDGFCRAERGRCVAGGERPGEGLPQEASPTGVGR